MPRSHTVIACALWGLVLVDPSMDRAWGPATARAQVVTAADRSDGASQGLAVTQGLRAALNSAAAIATRRQRFGAAVEALSAQQGRPISAAEARRRYACGGWAGPGCSGATRAIELAVAAIPVVAALYDIEYRDAVRWLADAVTTHAVWHDAYGFVYHASPDASRRGPGYAYAGCLWGRCDPEDPWSGQVSGVVYQLTRLAGIHRGPACGPHCSPQVIARLARH